MSTQIDKKKLLDAIKTVLPAVARKELFDQADKLAIDDGFLVAYNDAISIMQPVPELGDIAGAIDGRRLYELLIRMPDDGVVLDLEVRGGELAVSSRQSKIRASFSMADVELPISEIDQTGDYCDLPDKFLDDLGMIATTCARDMSRPVLTCVRFGSDVIEGTDGYRMARLRLSHDVLPSLLLPATTAELVAGSESIQVALGGKGEWVRFRSKSGTVICARTSSGSYPDLRGMYEVEGTSVTMPDGLRDVLDRAQVFSKRVHKIDEEVQVSMSPGKVIVKAEYPGGRFSETIPHRGQSAEGSFAIHPSFLSVALEEGTECVLGESKIKFFSSAWEHVIALR